MVGRGWNKQALLWIFGLDFRNAPNVKASGEKARQVENNLQQLGLYSIF